MSDPLIVPVASLMVEEVKNTDLLQIRLCIFPALEILIDVFTQLTIGFTV